MTEHLHHLIESMREELRHYGELLALLDTEQEQVMRRQADDLLLTVQAINTQTEAIHAARRERTQRQRELADFLELPAEAEIAKLMPLLPQAQRPLLTALVEESNQLLFRVRQRARQNHILLSRSMELMDKFMHSIFTASAPTYDEMGEIAASGGVRSGLYEGIG